MYPIQVEVTFHHLHVTQGWGGGGLDQEPTAGNTYVHTLTSYIHISLMPPRQMYATHQLGSQYMCTIQTTVRGCRQCDGQGREVHVKYTMWDCPSPVCSVTLPSMISGVHMRQVREVLAQKCGYRCAAWQHYCNSYLDCITNMWDENHNFSSTGNTKYIPR